MNKRWTIKDAELSTTIEQIRSKLKVDRVIASLLVQRNIVEFDDAEAFFRPKLTQLHDPFLMKGMDDAVSRVCSAISDNQKILLYGDYDVDGTTAVALMYEHLSQFSDQIAYYIPDRYKEGYGLSEQGVEFAIDNQFDLMITLDCGIKATERIEKLAAQGVDVIVCDHHEPGSSLPKAIILDPKQKGCEYPYKELSGCGVGFKLLEGIYRSEEKDINELFDSLDLVAISIGADIVEVTGENRALAFEGLNRMNDNPRTAFRALIERAGRSFPLSLTDVVFTIAPRINAAGRISSGSKAVDLMVSRDREAINLLVNEIQEYNEQRKMLDSSITEEALEQLNEMDPNRKANVVYAPSWHKGVIGIVASRIIEKDYRPTIVLTKSNDILAGSARSVQGFDLYSALEASSHDLIQFGGHKYAAGMTLEEEQLESFRSSFEKAVMDRIIPEHESEEVEIAMEMEFSELFGAEENRLKLPKLMRILRQFEPHGPGNMKPVFMARNVYSTDVRLLKGEHLKLKVTQPEHDLVIDAIGFGQAHHEEHVASGVPFDLAFTLEVNEWKGRQTMQLNIKDIRPSI